MRLDRKLALLGSRVAGPMARASDPNELPLLPADESDRAKERRERVERLRALVGGVVARDAARMRAAGPRAPRDAPPVPGDLRETPHGPLHALSQWLAPDHHHGEVRIARALSVCGETLARLALDPRVAPVDPRRALFLDTETTGLSGGTGTLPFLVGLAWFEDDSLRVEQLFLRRPGEEGPILRTLAERLDVASCLVSYNGKSFDWPLLRTRFVMNRVPMPPLPPHVDLLHCARRVYKRRLGEVRLVHVEANVLGMYREHDIDGAEIPGIYLEYVRRGDTTRVARVLEHNANDLVALAALAARIAERYDTLHASDDPRDHLGLATVAARAGDVERASLFARAAAEGGGDRDTTLEALLLAARLSRRARDRDAELAALDAAVGAAAPVHDLLAARAHLALAKLHEHRTQDLALAAHHAALTVPAEDEARRERRLARLAAAGARARAPGRRRSRRGPMRASGT